MKLLTALLLPLLLFSCNKAKKAQQYKPLPGSADALYQKYQLDKIKLPDSFSISVYAEVPNARSMTLSPSGVLYVGNRAEDKVYAVTDDNKDGKADKVYILASGLNTPNGVAFKNGHLYIATISSILKLENVEVNLANPPAPKVVYDKLPTDKHHGWKFIAFGPDGKLYIPVGAPCNICKSDNNIYSTITRMNDDGTGFEIFAEGIRNSVGFAWHPASKEMWFTENGRDMMGNDVPRDELNHAPAAGMHFGFPFCHEGSIPDPEFNIGTNCNDYTPPVEKLGAHVAALGMRFYKAAMFGDAYKNQVFIAEHGSWNRAEPLGYRVSLVKLDTTGRSLGYSTFADGWLQADGKVLGRPVDVEVMADGAMLISDDYSGVIYRVTKLAY